MKNKVIELKSGRKIRRYEDVCPSCDIFKGWKDKNQLGRDCNQCANNKIGVRKKGTSGNKAYKYKDISNIDIKDYIQVGNVTKYKMSCTRCGVDKGYIRPDSWKRLCSTCSTISITVQDCKLLAEKYNFLFMDDKYITYKHKHNWKCKSCDFVFKRAINDLRKRTNCPYCNRYSNEGECRKIFESTFNKKFIKIRPNFLKNPKTNYNLELDGYCEELKLAFEYDGEFHYKEDLWIYDNNDSLTNRQQMDRLKDDLCKNNGIILIRIPYWENSNLESYIKEQLIDTGVICAESR